MKKRNLFIGLAGITAIVSMNMRHAWMNYGITKNKILAGIVAEDPASNNAAETPSSAKVEHVKHNLEEDTIIHEYTCITFQTTRYYKLTSNGTRTLMATVDINYVEDSRTIKPANADTTGYTSKEYDSPSTGVFTSMEIKCGQYKKDHDCSPKSHISDCNILVRQDT